MRTKPSNAAKLSRSYFRDRKAMINNPSMTDFYKKSNHFVIRVSINQSWIHYYCV